MKPFVNRHLANSSIHVTANLPPLKESIFYQKCISILQDLAFKHSKSLGEITVHSRRRKKRPTPIPINAKRPRCWDPNAPKKTSHDAGY